MTAPRQPWPTISRILDRHAKDARESLGCVTGMLSSNGTRIRNRTDLAFVERQLLHAQREIADALNVVSRALRPDYDIDAFEARLKEIGR